MNINFDTSVNLGQIGAILTMVAGILIFTWRQSGAYATQVATLKGLMERMTSVEVEMRKQTDILIKLGQQDAQLAAGERRLDSAEGRISELVKELGLVKVQHAVDTSRSLREASQGSGALVEVARR